MKALLLGWSVTVAVVSVALAGCSGPREDRSDTATASNSSPIVATSTPTTPALASATATTSIASTATSASPPTATQEPTPTKVPTTTPTPEPSATPTSEPTATPSPTEPPPQPTATNTPVASDEFITIQRADTGELIVALTFDAGADRGYAAEILDTLRDAGVVATFGMTGVWAEENQDLVQRMVDEGHMLMNHTYDHKSWTGYSTGAAALTSAERADELQQTEQIVRDLTGYELRPYFRPPYGDYDDSVIADLFANGYTVNVMWTVDSLGWNGLRAAEIVRRVVDGTVPGAIHLFHVGAASEDWAALPEIIHELLDQGYRFVTIEEMVGR